MKYPVLRRVAFPAILTAALAAGASAAPALAQNANVTVIVNGQTMSFDQPPIEQAGRVYVPLRGIFQQLGASVVYQNGTINATGDGRNVTLHIGSSDATVNGQTQTLSSPPFVQGSRTLVPLRFVAQALGAAVDWNNNTSTVTITGGSGDRGNGGNNGNGNNYQQRPQPPMNPNAYVTDRRPVGAAGPMPTISARFAVPMSRDSLHVTLDGRDITDAVYFNADGFTWTSKRPLGQGRHDVRVSGTTRNGATFSTGWQFRI